jgi:WD40 repeat protein
VGAADNRVTVWTWETGQVFRVFGNKARGAVTSIAFSPDNKWLAIGSIDEPVTLWNLDSGECTDSLEGTSRSAGLAYSPDGTRLVVRTMQFDGAEKHD